MATKSSKFELTEEKGKPTRAMDIETGQVHDAPAAATVDSTSDQRTTNNVMRHEYRILSEGEKEQMKTVKDEGERFFAYCDRIGQSRELSLAKTKIEEAVMWAVKHITRPV
jgi:hypothetical protein